MTSSASPRSADARLWYAWMFPDEASAAKLVYHGGLLYTRSDTPAPTVDDARLTWIKPDGTLIYIDGTFAAQPLNVVTDPGEIAAAQFSDGGNGSFTNNSVNLSGFSGPGKGSSFDEAPRMEAVDVNMDGKPDVYGGNSKGGSPFPWLINNGGMDFEVDTEDFTLTDGGTWQAGSTVYACDFNNDGLPDFYTGAPV